jgi:flagellar hook-length control protein FliK
VTDPGSAASAAAPVQPGATALTVDSPIDSAPAAANAPAAGKIIGDSTKARSKLALPSAVGTNSQGPQAANASAPANPAPASNEVAATTSKQGGAHDDASNASQTDSGAAQSAQTQANASSPSQATNGSASAIPDSAPRINAPAVTAGTEISASPNAQTGPADIKADSAGIPNFGLSVANASAPSATVVVPATTGTPGTVPVAGLAVTIASRAQAGSNQFDIRLDPPELGRIDVRLDVDRDGHVTSHVTVDRADTLQLLQDQQPQMQQALEQAGLKTADNGLQFSLRDQSFAGQNNNGGGAQPSTAQLVIPDADLPAVQTTQAYNRLGLGTGIDIRV